MAKSKVTQKATPKTWPKKCDRCRMGEHELCWKAVCHCKHKKVIPKGKL